MLENYNLYLAQKAWLIFCIFFRLLNLLKACILAVLQILMILIQMHGNLARGPG